MLHRCGRCCADFGEHSAELEGENTRMSCEPRDKIESERERETAVVQDLAIAVVGLSPRVFRIIRIYPPNLSESI